MRSSLGYLHHQHSADSNHHLLQVLQSRLRQSNLPIQYHSQYCLLLLRPDL
nr:MAG TPA: hypothetical protein [Caudoviricetes sp.]